MVISCGTLIIYNNKVLLCHPTGNVDGNYSPPKGIVNDNESYIDCAIRETFEETGIQLFPFDFTLPILEIPYNKGKKVYKKVYLFLVYINSLVDIGLDGEIVPESQLQLNEVDWAGFLSKDEIKKKIFWRFKEYVLPLLNN